MEVLDATLKYVFDDDNWEDGLLIKMQKITEALDMVKNRDISELSEDEVEKIKAQVSLLEKQRVTLQEEVSYWQELIDKSSKNITKENIKPTVVIEDSNITVTSTPLTATSLRNRKTGDWKVTTDTKAQNNPRNEHDELSAELVHMARRLKQNNLALQDLIGKDKNVLGRAEVELTTGAGKFDTQHRELKKFTNTTWASTWRLIVLTLFVIVSLLMVFMLILVSSAK